jgi:predicted ribosomally synthesized peptide with nif11-like leader
MSVQGWEALTGLARKDSDVRARLESATDPDAVIAIAAEHGITLTPQDFVLPNEQLSDRELSMVSGSGVITAYQEELRGYCTGSCWATQTTCLDMTTCSS